MYQPAHPAGQGPPPVAYDVHLGKPEQILHPVGIIPVAAQQYPGHMGAQQAAGHPPPAHAAAFSGAQTAGYPVADAHRKRPHENGDQVGLK